MDAHILPNYIEHLNSAHEARWTRDAGCIPRFSTVDHAPDHQPHHGAPGRRSPGKERGSSWRSLTQRYSAVTAARSSFSRQGSRSSTGRGDSCHPPDALTVARIGDRRGKPSQPRHLPPVRPGSGFGSRDQCFQRCASIAGERRWCHSSHGPADQSFAESASNTIETSTDTDRGRTRRRDRN